MTPLAINANEHNKRNARIETARASIFASAASVGVACIALVGNGIRT